MTEEQQLSERVIIPMALAMVERIQNFRFINRLDSRAEAIRVLLEIALKIEEKKNAKK